jgi:nucleoside-diphosphate-sugar epimerase
MNVLVTGANGFIGSALCERLLADGYQVRGAVRDGRQMTVLPSGVERVQIGNIGPKTDWSKALAGIDGIVHLAARVHVMHDSAADPLSAFRRVNAAGTKRLAQQAAEAGVKRLVYISSVKVNGESTGDESRGQPSTQSYAVPRRSEVGGRRSEVGDQRSAVYAKLRRAKEVGGQGSVSKEFFSEKDVPQPQDPYAVSKWEAEQILHDVGADTGLEVVILRPPLVYGPEVSGNFLKLQRLVFTGLPMPLASIRNRRSLIYVGNLVDAIITCLIHPKAAGEIFLVSDGRDLSTSELIRLMAEAMGRKACLLSFPPSLLKIMGKLTGRSAEIERVVGSLCVDSSKIRVMLGWKPLFTVEEGIRKTSADYAGK